MTALRDSVESVDGTGFTVYGTPLRAGSRLHSMSFGGSLTFRYPPVAHDRVGHPSFSPHNLRASQPVD